MLIGQLRALAEGATYYGAVGKDAFPHMSLEDVMYRAPIVCLEAQMGLIDFTAKQNSALVEAAVMHDEIELNAIVEAGLDGLIAKIKAFFEKIKKFLASLVDKIILAFRKLTMTGHQLWEKYKNSDALNNLSSSADIEMEGYVFGDISEVINKTAKYKSKDDIDDLIDIACGPEVDTEALFNTIFNTMMKTGSDDFKNGSKNADAVNELITKFKEVPVEEREQRIVKELFDTSLTDSTLVEYLRERYVGDKKTLKFGSDGFTKEAVGAILGKDLTANQKTMSDHFKSLIKACNDAQTRFDRSISDRKRQISNQSEQEKKDKANENAVDSLVIAYSEAYTKVYSQVISVLETAQNACLGIIKDQNTQAKTMLGKMLSYKKKKDESLGGDIDMFDIITLEYDL